MPGTSPHRERGNEDGEMIQRQKTRKEGKQMVKKKGYAGSIQNSGSQFVKAPYAAETKRGHSTVKKGDDLRNGGNAGKK